MKRIAAIGACVLDTLIYCPVYPAEDTKNKADSVIKTGGGPVSNALVAAAKLGAAAEYLGAIPVGKEEWAIVCLHLIYYFLKCQAAEPVYLNEGMYPT